ncbi:hypothetical protein ILUMI_18599 [Ignelater luminosus]|uniref:YqaJ viral recombinase domain-containing protein n=1 Tax=Ignelater luminosus TaxID=2038154 RepID=A0A8K0G3Z8_IGNLU|nr:hypothetical protein ILUMI_18599 [Ignelater luminosus]
MEAKRNKHSGQKTRFQLSAKRRGKARNVKCHKSYGENCEKLNMNPLDFKIESRTFLEQLARTEEEIQEIQTQTKNERESDIWYLERRNRLTASTLGEYRMAREQLEKVFGKKTEPCGLFIDPKLPYLATSPDGFLDDLGLIEIKMSLASKRHDP